MRIATWNINSVRLRIHHVLRFIKEWNIDVMCLQETKTEDQFFPKAELNDIGMIYSSFRGENHIMVLLFSLEYQSKIEIMNYGVDLMILDIIL